MNRFVRLLIWIAAFLAAWTGIDYVYDTFITKEGFTFTPLDNLVLPMICGVIVWFILEKKNEK